MAITEHQATQIVRSISSNGPYTIEEARDIMKQLDKFPTGTTSSVRWVNVRTRRPVAFSY